LDRLCTKWMSSRFTILHFWVALKALTSQNFSSKQRFTIKQITFGGCQVHFLSKKKAKNCKHQFYPENPAQFQVKTYAWRQTKNLTMLTAKISQIKEQQHPGNWKIQALNWNWKNNLLLRNIKTAKWTGLVFTFQNFGDWWPELYRQMGIASQNIPLYLKHGSDKFKIKEKKKPI